MAGTWVTYLPLCLYPRNTNPVRRIIYTLSEWNTINVGNLLISLIINSISIHHTFSQCPFVGGYTEIGTQNNTRKAFNHLIIRKLMIKQEISLILLIISLLLIPTVQQHRHQLSQCQCNAPVLELAGQILSPMDGAKYHDIRWLPAHRSKLLPHLLLRLPLYGR